MHHLPRSQLINRKSVMRVLCVCRVQIAEERLQTFPVKSRGELEAPPPSTTTSFRVKSRGELEEARDDGVWGTQWHQLDHMQTTCTLLQTDNHTTPTPHHSIFTGRMLFMTPDQQCQSTEGTRKSNLASKYNIQVGVQLLHTLTTWHCPQSHAGHAAIDPYLLPAGLTAADLQQRVCCCGPVLGQTEREFIYQLKR